VPDKITVALFNSNSEVLELLREALQVSGYAAVIAHVEEVKRGRLDMIQFVEEHQPEVIVYDVAPPYDSNWTFLRLMMSSDVMRGRTDHRCGDPRARDAAQESCELEVTAARYPSSAR
jgi:CheY-like chemotaxis protein